MRRCLGKVLTKFAEQDENIYLIVGDIGFKVFDEFQEKFPQRFINIGLCEQSMIGVAAGLASEDFNVITTTFAPFQTMRCCEQIKVNLGYMGQKICMVGIASGLSLGTLGYTHCCIEDIGVLRSIPGITIISPADSLELVPPPPPPA